MMNNMAGLLNQFRSFMQNPAQMFGGMAQNALQNPKAAVQELMNSGRMSQQQFNQLQQMANNITRNPMFSQMFGK